MSKKKKNRKIKRPTLRGRGGFWSDAFGKAKAWTHRNRGLMDAGEAAINGVVPYGGSVLRNVGRLLGFGAYTAAPSGTLLASPVPTMHGGGEMGVRVCHTEYIGEVSSTVAYSIINRAINPGLSTTFPWLSHVASCFQKWEPLGITFVFKSLSATALNSTNTALGAIIGAVQYNAYAAAPVDKQTILNISGVRAGKPAENNMYPVECSKRDSMMKNLLVRTADVLDDKQKYDLGQFHLATAGSQAAAVVGELHVAYDIIFRQPVLPPASANVHSYFGNSINHANATPLGTQTALINTLGVVTSGTQITMPAGYSGGVVVFVEWTGGSQNFTLPAISYTNCATVALFNGGATGTLQSPPDGSAAVRSTYTVVLFPTNPALTWGITFGAAGSLPLAATYCNLTICPAWTVASALAAGKTMATLNEDPSQLLRISEDDSRNYCHCCEIEEKKVCSRVLCR